MLVPHTLIPTLVFRKFNRHIKCNYGYIHHQKYNRYEHFVIAIIAVVINVYVRLAYLLCFI